MRQSFYVVRIEFSESNFQLDTSKDIEFPHIPPLKQSPTFGNVMSLDMTLPEVGDFYKGIYGEILQIFVGSNYNFVSF